MLAGGKTEGLRPEGSQMRQAEEHGDDDAGDVEIDAPRRRRPDMRWTRKVTSRPRKKISSTVPAYRPSKLNQPARLVEDKKKCSDGRWALRLCA